jgi:hypothetical protein
MKQDGVTAGVARDEEPCESRSMAAFRIFLVGAQNAPTVEVDANDIGELSRQFQTNRFLEGCVTDEATGHEPVRVLIPISRIQMIAEATTI